MEVVFTSRKRLFENKEVKLDLVTEIYKKEKEFIKREYKILSQLVDENTFENIEKRKEWTKFGDVKGLEKGISEKGVTEVGTEVKFSFSLNKKEPKVKKIVCVYCKGNHYSSKCSMKSLLKNEKKIEKEEIFQKEQKSNVYVKPSNRKNDKRENEEQKTKIRISNLPNDACEHDIRRICSYFGEIVKISPVFRTIYDSEKNEKKIQINVYYVEFKSSIKAEEALKKINGLYFGEMILIATWAKQLEKK